MMKSMKNNVINACFKVTKNYVSLSTPNNEILSKCPI